MRENASNFNATPGKTSCYESENIFKSPLDLRKNDCSPFGASPDYNASASKPGTNFACDLARAFLSE